MEHSMKMFRKLTNHGLSLVELICAIAILGLVGVTIGSMLVISSNSYDKGITEVELQQEAQLVVNQISDLVIDSSTDPATSLSVQFSGGTLTIPEMTESGTIKTHTITLSGTELYYSCDGSTPELMAEGITGFNVDTSTFDSTGNLYLDIALERESRGNIRNFEATFHITSRNGVVETIPMASINIEDNIVLEPNQVFDFTTSVDGIADQGVTLTLVGGNTSSATYISGNRLTIADNEHGSVLQILAKTNATENGAPMAMRPVRVRIRRINDISVSGTLIYGTSLQANAQYKVVADLSGYNLDKLFDVTNDDDYVNPYGISFKVTASGTEVPILTTWGRDPVVPTQAVAVITLKEDMPNMSTITVTAYADHAYGTENAGTSSTPSNKTGLPYEEINDYFPLENMNTFVLSGGLSRGSDDAVGEFTGLESLKQLLIDKYGNGNYQPVKWHRFRAVNGDGSKGPWTDWMGGDPNDPTDKGTSINIRPCSGLMMDYDKAYEVQIKLTIINQDIVDADGKYKVMWPEADTPQSAYLIDAVMNKVTLSFKSSQLGFSAKTGFTCNTILTEEYYDNLFELDTVASLKRDLAENNIQYILEKKVNGTWTEVSRLQSGPQCRARFNQGNGDYRIKIWVKDCKKCLGYSGQPSHTANDHVLFDYNVYNGATGEGIFYFKVQKN